MENQQACVRGCVVGRRVIFGGDKVVFSDRDCTTNSVTKCDPSPKKPASFTSHNGRLLVAAASEMRHCSG